MSLAPCLGAGLEPLASRALGWPDRSERDLLAAIASVDTLGAGALCLFTGALGGRDGVIAWVEGDQAFLVFVLGLGAFVAADFLISGAADRPSLDHVRRSRASDPFAARQSALTSRVVLCFFSPRPEETRAMEASSIMAEAGRLILAADPDLLEIVGLSLRVTLTAVLLSCLIGLPLGAAVGAFRFPGRPLATVILNALMGLPPVVVGLSVYLALSASGPLGPLRLLYTPEAMILAQTILVTPIVAALTRQVVEDLHAEYAEQFASLGVGPGARVGALLWDARYSLLTVALAGFGRAVAEVGAVLIVGGNINHVTRVMTTTIALETSKGNLELALALGVVLLALALAVNAAVMAVRAAAIRAAYV